MYEELDALNSHLWNQLYSLSIDKNASHYYQKTTKGIDKRLTKAEQDIADLQNEQVIAEHFYLNDEFRVPDYNELMCFEEFVLPAGNTLDFAASFSSTFAEHEYNSFNYI